MFRVRISQRRAGLASGHVTSELRVDESRGEEDASTRLSEGGSKNCNEDPRVCGKEAACRRLDDRTSKCVCPHDLSPPTKNLKCPNRLLVPVTPRPIYNIIPPNNGDPTINGTDPQQVQGVYHDDITKTVGITTACIAILSLLSIIVYLGRGKCNGTAKSQRSAATSNTSPMNLRKGLLLANKYTPNLQYYAPPTQVPILVRDDIVFLNEIGEGCFGKVFKGEIRCNEGEQGSSSTTVAVKVLKESASREAEQDFMREVEITSTFRHDNILSLLGVVLGASGPWMVFEYMPHGDLAGVLRANAKNAKIPTPGLRPITEISLDWITLQIAAGMSYLSSQRFVHRDLACRNCLVGTDLVVKIADFGMSRDVYTCDYYKIGGSRLLPIRWMSPESVMYGRFTLESDVWSFGVVVWEIYSYGKQPYYGRNNEEVVELILRGTTLIPDEDSPPFINEIMRDCWKPEPRDRLRFIEIHEKLEKNRRGRAAAELSTKNGETLPRPPQGPVTIRSRDVLDTEGYLLPAPALPIEYLQTIADSDDSR